MFILIIFNLFLYIEWGRNLFVFYLCVFYLFMCILFICTLYFIYLHIVFVFYLTWVANYLSWKPIFSPKGLYLAHKSSSFTYMYGLLFPSPDPILPAKEITLSLRCNGETDFSSVTVTMQGFQFCLLTQHIQSSPSDFSFLGSVGILRILPHLLTV